MDAFPNFSVERRKQLCEAAEDVIGLDAASIEKDFWVCWILKELFSLPETGPHLTFKGGTSLSKCWKLIDRFSEDVDVVIGRDFLGFGDEKDPQYPGLSSNERNRRLQALRSACQTHVRAKLGPELKTAIEKKMPKNEQWKLADDESDPDGQTLLLKYPSSFPAGAYLRPVVKIELGARSDTEPSELPAIQSYLAEALPGESSIDPFKIRTVAPERTFWEKAMLLHEETYRTGDGPKGRLARHYYDLWCLILKGVAKKAVADQGLFERVAAHRAVFFRKRKEAQDSLQLGTLRLLPAKEHRVAWEMDYESMRESMFFGETPDFSAILETIGRFEMEFNSKKL